MSIPLSFSISIAAVLAMSVTGIQVASAEQMTGLNKVEWNGQTYDIKYNVTNARVESIKVMESGLSVKLSNSSAEDGALTLALPMGLVKSMFSHDSHFPIQDFINVFADQASTSQYGVLESTCDLVTLEIKFPQGSEDIGLFSSSTPSNYYKADSQQEKVYITPELSAEGKQFKLDTVTNADSCAFSLIKDDKRLHIAIQNNGSV